MTNLTAANSTSEELQDEIKRLKNGLHIYVKFNTDGKLDSRIGIRKLDISYLRDELAIVLNTQHNNS